MFVFSKNRTISRNCLLTFVFFIHFGIAFASQSSLKIRNIFIKGNNIVSDDAINRVITYKVGADYCEDDSARNIKAIDSLEYFEEISILKKQDGDVVDLLIDLKEKQILVGFEIEGNHVISTKKLLEKVKIDTYKAISGHDVRYFIRQIQIEYRNVNYLDVKIDHKIEVVDRSQQKVILKLKVKEGSKTNLTRVNFYGNELLDEVCFRGKIHTKEDWLLSAIDGSGRFNRDAIEADRKMIEEIYQDKGFLNAKVTDVRVRHNDVQKQLAVDFYINEGEKSNIRFITVPSESEISSSRLKKALAIHNGDLYSKSKLIRSMDRIKHIFGEYGYIYCDVYPDIKPVEGSLNLVDIDFFVEKGKKYKINKIKITGNKSTQDNVIRREISFFEGDLANKRQMDIAQEDIEALGYFEKNQVDWAIKRVGDDKVDLELNVKEARTGMATFGIDVGGDYASSRPTPKLNASIQKRNLGGMGWDLSTNIQSGGSQFIKSGEIDFFNPRVFDQNILFSFNTYLRNVEYDEAGSVYQIAPVEQTKGLIARCGFALFPYDAKIKTILETGVEGIGYANEPRLAINRVSQDLQNFIARDKLKKGAYGWLSASLVKDCRNHPLYPTKGFRGELNQKFVPSVFSENFDMLKTELDYTHYFPLISKERLTLSSHVKLGFIGQWSDSKPVPNKELYHIGGPSSLRGFRWGEAGPSYKVGLGQFPLGAKKSLVANFELITPLSFAPHADMATPRGYLFYDVGTGWDYPKDVTTALLNDSRIFNNDFNLRHTVGFGVKFTTPYPIKIDWGYKLDRKSLTKERPSELHITMNIPL